MQFAKRTIPQVSLMGLVAFGITMVFILAAGITITRDLVLFTMLLDGICMALILVGQACEEFAKNDPRGVLLRARASTKAQPKKPVTRRKK